MGIRSKAVDSLIHSALSATNLDDLEAATRALDRVLIYSFYLVPEYYAPGARIGYKSSLGFPKIVPNSYLYEDWVINYWYAKAPGGHVSQTTQAAQSASSTTATAH
jgi:ABC-type oligopeptide transport system, periplasmic component